MNVAHGLSVARRHCLDINFWTLTGLFLSIYLDGLLAHTFLEKIRIARAYTATISFSSKGKIDGFV